MDFLGKFPGYSYILPIQKSENLSVNISMLILDHKMLNWAVLETFLLLKRKSDIGKVTMRGQEKI